jgi:hypothetical protein
VRLSRDITRWAFLMEIDGAQRAGLAVGLSVISPFSVRTGASASPFSRAHAFGLPMLDSVDELSLGNSGNHFGWCVEQIAGETLSVRCPDGEPLVPDVELDLPPGWLESAEAAGSVMLVVSHVLPVTDDPLGALALETGHRTVCAGPVRFGAPEILMDEVAVWNPLGDLRDLATDVVEQILSLDEAKRRARVLAQDSMFCATFEATVDELLQQDLDYPGLFDAQYAYWRLVAEVADTCGAEGVWQAAARLAVEAAIAVVAERCDSAVFEDADAVSARLIARQSDPQDLVPALVSSARLWLATRGPADFAADHYARVVQTTWAARAEAELYRLWFRDEDPLQEESHRLVAEAAQLLVRALELDGVTTRPLLLASLAQIYLDENGVYQDAAAAALSELLDSPTLTAPDLALFLLRVVHGLQPETVSELLAAVFGTPFADFVACFGKTVTMKVVSQGVNLARERADRPLLRTALDWVDRLEVRWDAAHRRQFIEARAHALPDDPTPCPRPDEALVVSFPDSWTQSQRSAASLHAAAHARDRSQPALGLALLSQATDEMSEEVRLLTADLHYQAATAGEPIPGPLPFPWGHYTYAALAYASLNMTELARASLVPFAQRVGNLRGEDLRGALYAIIVDLPNFDASGAPELGELLRDLVHTAIWQMAAEHQTMPMGLMLGLHQAAKGPELGAWWRLEGPVTLPVHIQHFVGRLRDLGSSTAVSASSPNLLDDVDADDRPAGGDDTQIARNLRWRISSLIDTELKRGTAPLIDDQYLWAKAHELLDERTVLLTWFLPMFVRGAALLLGVTRESRALMVNLGEGDGESEVRHPVADVVEAIREEIQHDPLFADVTPEGARLLDSGNLLGGNGHWAEWRAQGKDRLLVWPHGAVHYLPIPLCRIGGRLIADDWTVTTIAGLESLTSVGGCERDRRTTVLASSAGGVRYGLHDEPALEEHARMVAGAVGVEAIVGAAATKARLLAELSASDIVHIAVHGTMDRDAPWLQCLYLTPDSDDDGQVFAYDFLEVDLRGVRLVTLAACESALGRFDRADNVRGIPSALITAGAQAVVGCLWPVRPAPAAYFYHYMHHGIAEGADPVEAFREAQLATRIQHPQYRDWGAFTYLHGRNKGVTA